LVSRQIVEYRITRTAQHYRDVIAKALECVGMRPDMLAAFGGLAASAAEAFDLSELAE